QCGRVQEAHAVRRGKEIALAEVHLPLRFPRARGSETVLRLLLERTGRWLLGRLGHQSVAPVVGDAGTTADMPALASATLLPYRAMMFAVSICACTCRLLMSDRCACACSAARFGSSAIFGCGADSIVPNNSTLCDEMAEQAVRPQRTGPDPDQMLDGSG